jgi:LPXTG-motif cell wall-anchored protein
MVVATIAAALSGIGTPASSQNASAYALSGDARAAELAIAGQGVTLGAAISRADSKPSAEGLGAGQCSLLGDAPDPSKVTCEAATTEQSSSPGEGGEDGATCSAPALPDPLGTVVTIASACGASTSTIAKGVPTTLNEGKVLEAGIELDLSGLSAELQGVKEQVVDALQDVLGQAPEPINTALTQLLDVVDLGQAGQLQIGVAESNIGAVENGVQVVSTAAGARIGVLGIPEIDDDGDPIPGTADATTNGLLIVEVGQSRASVTVDTEKASAEAAASPSIVTLKVRDITQLQPTYTEIPVAPGQSQTVLEGTPLESTIVAAASDVANEGTSAAASSAAVRLDLIKGVQGGIQLALGRTNAAAQVQAAEGTDPQPAPDEDPLPATGGNSMWVKLGFVLLIGAGVVVWIRRRTA